MSAVFKMRTVALIFAMVLVATVPPPTEALRGGLIRSGRAADPIMIPVIENPPSLATFFVRPIRAPKTQEFIRFGRAPEERILYRMRRGDSDEEESARFG